MFFVKFHESSSNLIMVHHGTVIIHVLLRLTHYVHKAYSEDYLEVY